MNRNVLIPAAWLLDQLAGDPEWLPHPVRLIGLAVSQGEKRIRRSGQSKSFELVSGGALSLAIVFTSYFLTNQAIRLAYRRSSELGSSLELAIAWTCLAARNLQQEATSVVNALDLGDFPLARQRLARIVGRDTQHLDKPEICRALIETLAESASDGIVAPLFYMALGGVPLAMAYKAVNTLDSMIGHADAHYFFFGKTAARLDDAANFLPARVTAVAMSLSSMLYGNAHFRSAWRTWLRDGRKHRSPNAGQPESAMAGGLQVCLGGSNRYAGELIATAQIGVEFPAPSVRQAKRAICLVSLVTLLGIGANILLSTLMLSQQTGRNLQ